jgi:hypothetical protein
MDQEILYHSIGIHGPESIGATVDGKTGCVAYFIRINSPLHLDTPGAASALQTTATYISTTGCSPGIFIGAQGQANQEALRIELKGEYDGPNPKLLGKFFPFLNHDGGHAPKSHILQSLAGLYGDASRPSAKIAKGRWRKNLSKGLKDILRPPVHKKARSLWIDSARGPRSGWLGSLLWLGRDR